MILLLHHKEIVIKIVDLDTDQDLVYENNNPLQSLFDIALKNPDRILIWCHRDQKNNLNLEGLKNSLFLKNMMLSYSDSSYIPSQIGYIENSPFININKKVKYPTWIMSSQIGAIYSSQLKKFKGIIDTTTSFDYALNSIAKLGMPKGLLCYSNPSLLIDTPKKSDSKNASLSQLFKFVKQHYKTRWILLLLLNLIVYEKRLPIFAALRSLGYKKKKFTQAFDMERVTTKEISIDTTIDVIIPTIGRKKYLYDVIKDLANQSCLPKNVIIVEQNSDKNSKSELDYLRSEAWPFNVKHHFIHQTGACHARNLALKDVTSNLVFLGDDDNRFNNKLLSDIIYNIEYYNLDVITMSCLQINEIENVITPLQWSTFGAGSSVMKSKYLSDVKFNMALEFGYGEDVDFGMQLRNNGVDIIYFPEIKIVHLKAPIGGFRVNSKQNWKMDKIKSKPSPTVMLNRILNNTKHQLLGYKTTLFIKYYRKQPLKNPYSYFKLFNKEWRQSVYWANILKENNNL